MKTLRFTVGFLATATVALCCDCGWAGAFVDMAASPKTVVVVARVKEYRFVHVSAQREKAAESILSQHLSGHNPLDEPIPDAMVLEIEEVLSGPKDFVKHEQLVFGDNGVQCRPYVTTFPVGTRWAFVLFGTPEETYLSICGEFTLPEKEDGFFGVIYGKNPKRHRSISLDALGKKIRANQIITAQRASRVAD